MTAGSPSLLDGARDRMAAAEGELQRLETAAEALLRGGELERAAAWAEAAGHFGALNHPGRFASPRLERVLGEIGRRAVPASPGRLRAAPPRRVLHVLTEAYDTGGHTRVAWRWIRGDAGRAHSVVLTAPGGAVPRPLREAVADSGGALHRLDGADRIARARALRALADDADLVVLHVHMFDVVAPIALADRPDGPPVLFEDHADHMFWLGTGVADAVAGLRAPAVELAATRRGVGADRAVLLPIPVPPLRRTMTREEARAALGLEPDGPVLLTVAMPFKYAPVLAPSFFDVIVPVLHAHPDALLLAVGPEPAGAWEEAAEATGGRVRAAGLQRDLAPYYHAADVYVDSYPFSSNTALIEAAGHGVPVLSFSPDPARQAILLSNDPGIEDLIVRAATPAAYAGAAAGLLDDPGAARALGERTREGIERSHAGPDWLARLEHAYATATSAGPPPLMPPPREPAPTARWEAVIGSLFAHAGQTPSLTAVAGAHGVAEPGVAPELPEPEALLPWDAVALPAADAGALARALDALARLDAEHELARLAVALAPEDVPAAVPLIEAWLDVHPDVTLDLVPVEDPEPLVALGTVLVLAPGHPLEAPARRRGVAVVPA